MLDYSLWRDRLKDEMDHVVKKVGFAADVKSVLRNATKTSPSIFVIPKDESGKTLSSTGASRTLVNAGVDVLIIASDFTDATGGKVQSKLKETREAVDSVLINWKPPGACDQIGWKSGKRLGMHKGLLIWTDTYTCQFFKG